MPELQKRTHKINLGPAVQGFPENLPVKLIDKISQEKPLGDMTQEELVAAMEINKVYYKFLRQGVRGNACKQGLRDMITANTVREVYSIKQHAIFLYRNFRKGRIHPYTISNGVMNDLAAGNHIMFLDFFLGNILALHGRTEFSPKWLKKQLPMDKQDYLKKYYGVDDEN